MEAMKNRMTPEEFVKLAREMPRDERVPYAFEKRVMANLAPAAIPDALTQWTRALWRSVAPCLAVAIVAALVSFSRANQNAIDLDSALETAVLTPPEQFPLELEP